MDELAVGATFAEHLIRGVAGRGGMGVVYRALHVPLKREVALKVMAPEMSVNDEFRTRFRREFEAAAAIDHRNVVPIFHAGEEAGLLYVTMPLIEGTDLGRLLALEGPLAPVRAARIVAQIGAGLDAAHALGIVHRDVKPANILLDGDGQALLSDFGLTKQMDSDSELTQAGTLLGSFDYIPPEQLDGAAVDARTDVYALGCVLFQTLTGSVPYPRPTIAAKIFAHLSAAPPAVTAFVPDAPPGLDAVITRALAKAPDDRYASAGALASDALDAVGASDPRGAPLPARPAAAASVLPPQLRGEGLSAFVGRSEPLAELERRYALAADGERQFALVGGEAGIGKSRLVTEFARRVHGEDAQVLFGRSDPESLVPYQPFITAIQHYIAHRDTLTFPPELEPELRELARFVPALRPRLSGTSEPIASDPETQRYRLFAAVTRVLAFIAGSAPTVLVLDDLQWADSSTALLLAHVWRDPEPIRLLVLATFREPGETPCPELASYLATLSSDPAFVRLALAGLDAGETSALVTAYGRDTDVSGLLERTDGNPFFIVETLRAGDLDGPVPAGVKDLIGHRLARLSESANLALMTAAVVGPEFRLEVLERVLAQDVDTILGALEEAIATGLIREVEEDVDRFAFTHALIREALYERQITSRRARAHLAVAEALEAVGAPPAELAHHFLASRHLDTGGKAIDYSVRAAELAAGSLAYEEAVGHYRRALERVTDPVRRCDLLLGLAGAQLHASDATSRETFREVAALARELALPEQFGRAALGVAARYAEVVAADLDAIALLEEALVLLGEREDTLVVQVNAALANNLHFQRAETRTMALSSAALAMARRLDDPEALVAALQARHTALFHVSHLEERLRLSEDWLALARRIGAPELEALGLYASIYGRLEAADMDAVHREIERLTELGEALQQPLYRHMAMNWRVALCQRISEAEQLAAASHALGTQAHARDTDQVYATQLLSMRYREERTFEFAPLMAAGLEANPHLIVYRPSLAVAYLRGGERAAGIEQFELVATDDFSLLPRDQLWLSGTCLLAEACSLIGDAARARILYAQLLPYRRRNVVIGMTTCFGSTERYLGMVAPDPATALEHFAAAVADDDARGLRDNAAIARSDYADALLAVGSDEQARVVLEECIAGAEACELPRLAARARERISP